MFYDWLMLLANAVKNNLPGEALICPECKHKGIEYIYIGDPETRVGYLPAWCKNCNKGIRICRAMIPKNAKMIEYGDLDSIKKIVPNFEEIYPKD